MYFKNSARSGADEFVHRFRKICDRKLKFITLSLMKNNKTIPLFPSDTPRLVEIILKNTENVDTS